MKRAAVAVVAMLALGGCSIAGDVAGVVAAGVTGSATANPAVGIAVGIAVRSGVNALGDYFTRKRHQGEQDEIATVAGTAPLGAPRAWEIRHTIPIGNHHGELEAVREFKTPLTTCREIVFTVADGSDRDILTTTLCQQADGWRWAAAEPAVPRWGFLQ